MSCPFYWWNYDYACRKSGKDVSEDIYYKYCRNYSYDECPVYRQESPSDSRCYLTTACIRARNLPDDCRELTAFRHFRDEYVKKQPDGNQDIAHYYAVAPKIVEKISQQRNSCELYNRIYENLIVPCVAFMETGEFENAYSMYKNYTSQLEKQYISDDMTV